MQNVTLFESTVETLLKATIKSPPKLSHQVGEFIVDMKKHLFDLNSYFEQTPAFPSAKKLYGLVVSVIFTLHDSILNNQSEFIKYYDMEKTSPYNISMGLHIILASLVTIIEDRWTRFKPDGLAKKPWQVLLSATTFQYLVDNTLVVNSSVPIKSYSLSQVVNAMELLSIYWYRLEWHEELFTYVYGLFHRYCIISATPQKDAVWDCTSDNMEVTMVYNLRMCSWFYRMMFMLNYWKNNSDHGTVVSLFDGDSRLVAANIKNMRANMREQILYLQKTRDAKQEIMNAFPCLLLRYGDAEKFANRRGLETAGPTIKIMTLRPEVHPPMTVMNQQVLLSSIFDHVIDESENFFERFTMMEHIYVSLLKLYALNMFFSPFGIDIFHDFVVYELSFPMTVKRFEKNDEPLFVQFFGRFHVFFRSRVYHCAGVDTAIVTWLRIIILKLGGRLCDKNVTPAVNKMLGMIHYQAESTPMMNIAFKTDNTKPLTALFSDGEMIID